ncbi:MAG: ribonuclease HI [Spirochaetia bacterium]|nr:ribonuclease HI [Spirochaetia bacterium]
MKKTIEIYTDGGCSGNPGPGGWAYVLITDDGTVITNSGSSMLTTNNKMELTAVIRALESVSRNPLNAPLNLIVHTDSQYVKNGITTWIHSWVRNGWRTAAKKEVKNKELWLELQQVAENLKIEWKWVKGHAGVEHNELCDTLVQKEIASIR